MKITKGDVTIVVEAGDDPHQAVELIRALDGKAQTGHQKSTQAALSPKQSVVYEALCEYPDGAHYTVIAKDTGLSKNIANTRLAALVTIYKQKLVARIGSGVYKVVAE